MKKIFLSVCFLMIAGFVFSQHPIGNDSFQLQTVGDSKTLVKSKAALGSDSGFVNAKYADTSDANKGHLKNYPGAQIRVGDSLWMRNTTATKWLNITGTGTVASPLALQTNGVNNGSQTLLNLHQGTGMTLTDNGSGQVTFDATPFDTSILRGVYMDTVFLVNDTTMRACKGTTCWDMRIGSTLITFEGDTVTINNITIRNKLKIPVTDTTHAKKGCGNIIYDTIREHYYGDVCINGVHSAWECFDCDIYVSSYTKNGSNDSTVLTLNNGTRYAASDRTGTGTVTDVTATLPITITGTSTITPNVTTSMATNKLIGRYSAGTGVMQEVTISTGLALDGSGNLTATGLAAVPTWQQTLIAGSALTQDNTVTGNSHDFTISGLTNLNLTSNNNSTLQSINRTTVNSLDSTYIQAANDLELSSVNIHDRATTSNVWGYTTSQLWTANTSGMFRTGSAYSYSNKNKVVIIDTTTGAINHSTLDSNLVIGLHTKGFYDSLYLNKGVTSWSAGTTGFTPNTATTGAVTLAGVLVEANGGTHQSTYTTGDILYASASNTLSKLPIGTTGQHLQVVSGIPAWRDTTAAGGAFWALASGGTLSGVNTITSSRPLGLIWNGTFTQTATADYFTSWQPTVTADATVSDAFNMFQIKPTINAGANSQSLSALTIDGSNMSVNGKTSVLLSGIRIYGLGSTNAIRIGVASSNTTGSTIGVDASNNLFFVGANGAATFSATTVTAPGFIGNTGGGGLATNATLASSNLWANGGSGTTTSTGLGSVYGGSSTVDFRVMLNGGSSANAVSNNESYFNLGLGTTTTTVAAAANMKWMSNLVVRTPANPSLGAGSTVGSTATVFIEGAQTGSVSGANWALYDSSGNNAFAGKSVFGSATIPTALVMLAAGTATANTAPLKFTSGTDLATGEDGAVNYNGTDLRLSVGTTWYNITKDLSGSATLDFPNTLAQTDADLTITVTGAADGDVVSLGVPNGSTLAGSCYTAWVSAANTVTVRFSVYGIAAKDPASGTFKVRVIK